MFRHAGLICIAAFISPYRADRDRARSACGDGFHEIHIATDLATCELRDPKGLYKKARSGDLPELTGIGAPSDAPYQAQFTLDTAKDTLGGNLE